MRLKFETRYERKRVQALQNSAFWKHRHSSLQLWKGKLKIDELDILIYTPPLPHGSSGKQRWAAASCWIKDEYTNVMAYELLPLADITKFLAAYFYLAWHMPFHERHLVKDMRWEKLIGKDSWEESQLRWNSDVDKNNLRQLLGNKICLD